MLGLKVVLLLFSLLLVQAENFYDDNPHIIELTPKSFDRVIHKTNYTTLVEFYAPWCGYCKQLKGTMQKVAKVLDGLVQVATVNCDNPKNKQLCAQNRVQGFPTLIVFRPPKVNLDDVKIKKSIHISETYSGERKLKPIVEFTTSRMKNYVKRLTKLDNLANVILDNRFRYSLILFSKNESVSPLHKSLALDWLGMIDFYVINNNKINTSCTFEVKSHPNITTFIYGLKQSQSSSTKSRLVLFDKINDEYHDFNDSFSNKLSITNFLMKFTDPKEGPLTKRQTFLDRLKLGKENKKKLLEHDEL